MGDALSRIQTNFSSRPDYGEHCDHEVSLWANYFEMTLHNPGLVLHLYEMTLEAFPSNVSPSREQEMIVPKGKMLMQVIRCALNTSTFHEIRSDIATDFDKTLISCKKLDDSNMQTGKFKFWAEHELKNGKPQPRKEANRFQMTLEAKSQLHVSELTDYLASGTKRKGVCENISPIIQALDIILGHYGKLSLEIVTPKRGKCFPQEPGDGEKFAIEGPESYEGYLEGVRGFFASVRATADRTLVNCNACYGAFYKPIPLVTLFKMFIRKKHASSLKQLKKLEKAIQGLRVELNHLKDDSGEPVRSIRTILGLAPSCGGPEVVQFRHEKEKKTYTIAAYWEKQGYRPAQIHGYPVINVGTKERSCFVPPHVCKIVSGQMAKRKLDPTQTANMIENAIRRPDVTKKSINGDAFRILGFENNATLSSFCISLNDEMVTVQGRVLEQPMILYRNDFTPTIHDNARWSRRGSQAFRSGQLKKWGVLRITRDAKNIEGEQMKFDESFEEFLDILTQTLGQNQVEWPVASWRQTIVERDVNALKRAFEHCEEMGIRFLMIVLPNSDARTYNQIKRFGDIEYGIATTCVLGGNTGDKFYKLPVETARQYFANVSLKINLKLEGVNHILHNQTAIYMETMVIGIDVTHPSPGPSKRTAPSVAAMVASVDKELAQWPVDLRINTAGQEMVDLLGSMLTSRLQLWKAKHEESLPEHLLIYRDGVSESQYKTVIEEELVKLRNTCEIIYGGRSLPRITFILVSKRHHTRFFKKTDSEICTNPRFGTVVDADITHVRNWDFFLQSHHALKGTARPAHYIVLLNEIFTQAFVGPNLKISDCIQYLTYHMCFLYGRSTTPVSIPPPVYYAHLACARSRCYGHFDDDGRTAEAKLEVKDRGKLPARQTEEGELRETAALSNAEGKRPEPRDDLEQGKDVAEVRIHPRLKDTMFYV